MEIPINITESLAISSKYLQDFINFKAGKDLNVKYKDGVNAISFSDLPLAYPFERDIEANSIAFHQITGIITYQSWWRFSTANFIDELKAAEENPSFIAHLLYVDSPGGDVFGLHEAVNVIKDLKKPVYAVINKVGCSAGYWLASAAKKIYATSPLSNIGSIGVMGTLLDERENDKMNGYKFIEIYASKSSDKNKTYRDAIDGKTQEYIEKYLDPVMSVFETDVTSVRELSSEVLSGDDYFAPQAQELNLIDGIMSVEDVVQELYNLAIQDHSNDIVIRNINQFINQN